MGRILFTALVLGIAGLLAWLITAPFAPAAPRLTRQQMIQIENPIKGGEPISVPVDPSQTTSPEELERLTEQLKEYNKRWPAYEFSFIVALGAFIGLALGGINGYFQGSAKHALRGASLGLIIGIISAPFGHSIGAGLATAFFGPRFFDTTTNLALLIPARILVATPVGALLGLCLGITAKSFKQCTVGFIGGAIGAACGGAVFDPVSMALSPILQRMSDNGEAGAPGRAVLAILMGAGIGLFTSLLQRATRTAWVRLILGRNEGKEWIVDAQQTLIGRSETAHVPLFGDMSVAPFHAAINRQGGQYYLADCGTTIGTFLNGQPIQQVPLFSGARIRIGQHELEFITRMGAAPVNAAEKYRAGAPASQSVPVQPYQPQQPPRPVQPVQPVQPMQPSQPTQVVQPMPMNQPTTVMQPIGMQALALVGMSGPITGQRFPILSNIEVGRDLATIPLSFDTMVSRKHATLSPMQDGIQVNDMGSTNGTFVNDQRIQSAILHVGDMLRLGSTTFRIEPST